MRINIENGKPRFQPIKIEITIENKRELEFWICLFNASPSDAADFANGCIPDKNKFRTFSWDEVRSMLSFPAWQKLTEIERNLKP